MAPEVVFGGADVKARVARLAALVEVATWQGGVGLDVPEVGVAGAGVAGMGVAGGWLVAAHGDGIATFSLVTSNLGISDLLDGN